jgi:hypothetical protein
MHHQIDVPREQWNEIHSHLLRGYVEQAAVLFTKVSQTTDGLVFSSVRHHCFSAKEFDFQSAYHIELSDEARGWMIQTAWRLGTAIVELHSHVSPKYPAVFSESDFNGFREFVPHVWWRLRGRPYAAVVVAPTGVDGLVWANDPDTPAPLAAIYAGSLHITPTGRSILPRRRINVR